MFFKRRKEEKGKQEGKRARAIDSIPHPIVYDRPELRLPPLQPLNRPGH
jgi:hypothetical protein